MHRERQDMHADTEPQRKTARDWRDDAARTMEHRHRDAIAASLAHLEEYALYLRQVIATDWSMVRASTFAAEMGKDINAILERLNTLRAITETRDIYTAKDPEGE